MIGGLLQPGHLIVILIIVIIIFGPGKLPEIGGAIGKSLREFRRSTSEVAGEEEKPATAGPATAATAITESRLCPTCLARNPIGNKFCSQCGDKLDQD